MRRLTRDPAELIPLQHSTCQVPLALDDGEATRYTALGGMVEEGLVTESTTKGDASGGPTRRYDQRTGFGRAVARAESERLRARLDVARVQNMFGGPK